MTPPEPHAEATQASLGSSPGHAGTMLRAAREAAGMSIDAVSQQLKLAPRQVKAIEDGDFALLPGRTFVRGFARNYARLVRLDPDMIVDALTGAPTEGGLESPPLHSTAITMGELPSSSNGRPVGLRWVISAVVLALVVAGIAYEYFRGDRGPGTSSSTTPAAVAAPAGGKSADGTVSPPSQAGASGSSADAPGTVAAPALTPLRGEPNAPTGGGSTSEGTAIAPLSVALRGPSWVEIKDSSGRVLLSQTMGGGQTQVVLGTPPFDVVLGNAMEVTVTFRGRGIDLGPFTRQNVARLTLQ